MAAAGAGASEASASKPGGARPGRSPARRCPSCAGWNAPLRWGRGDEPGGARWPVAGRRAPGRHVRGMRGPGLAAGGGGGGSSPAAARKRPPPPWLPEIARRPRPPPTDKSPAAYCPPPPPFGIVRPLRDTPRERRFAERSVPLAIELGPDELVVGID